MATAIFEPGMESAKTEDLWQYDYGQILRIEGLELPFAVEIHFSTQKKEGEAEKAMGVTKDGATEVRIPDSMLENQGSTSSYSIYAFIYLADETSGKTICWTQTRVKPRPKPAPERPDEEREDLFREAIRAVNDAAGRAETSAGEAGLSQEASSANAAKTAEDRQEIEEREKNMAAMEISMSENAELAERCKSQAQAAATNALQSEQAAKEAQAASEAARAGAETAESQAGLYAQRAEEDKDTVEQAKAVVMQLGREVTNNKDSVEKTTQGFALLAEQKTADINNAGQAQYDRIEEAREQAVGEIGTAKTQAVQAVQQEGATQMQNVQEAAAAIEADREQIEINRAGIAALQEEAGNDAPGIACAASGKTILATDSSSKCFRGLRLYGRTTQETTTGAQLLDLPDREIYTEYGVGITIKNGVVNCDAINTGGPISLVGTYTNKTPIFALPPGTYTSNVTLRHYDGVTMENRSGTFMLDETYEVTNIAIGTGGAVVGNNYPMLNAGTELLPWEPYTGGTPSPNPDYPQELVSAGDKGSIEVDVLGGNILNPEIGSITDMNIRAGTKLTIRTKDDVPSNGGNVLFKTADNENVWLGIDAGINKRQIVLLKDVVKFENRLVSGIEHALYIGDGKDYEPYHALQNIAMLAPNSIPGIPVSSGGNYTDETGQQWIADYRDWEHGVDVQMVDTVILTQNNTWIIDDANDGYGTATRIRTASNTLPNASTGNARQKILCNKGNYASSLNHYATCFISNKMFYYCLGYEPDITTIEEFVEQIVSDDGIQVLYPLATPIETPIPADELAAYQALHTNTPTTTITNDEDCWMEAGYTADTKAHIEQNYVPKESYMALEKRVAALETQAIENI